MKDIKTHPLEIKGLWVACVEGLAYGFFDTQDDANVWLRAEFPVASAQGRTEVYEFCSGDFTRKEVN